MNTKLEKKLESLPKAIIFDFDGTLLDSEKDFFVFWKLAAKHFGYDFSDEFSLSLRSTDKYVAERHMKETYGEDIDYFKIREVRRKLMDDYYKENPPEFKEGVIECLSYIASKDIPMYIGSQSDAKRIQGFLDMIDGNKYFKDIISGHDLKRGKPYPDIYLKLCSQIKLDPKDVLVVEDSPNGVKSAYDAGCKVLLVQDLGTWTSKDSLMVDSYLKSLKDINKII